MKDIGPLIRTARRAARLSQKELARHVGRTSKTIRRYEHGHTRPDIRILQRIARATNRPIDYFFDQASRATIHSGTRPPRSAASDGVLPEQEQSRPASPPGLASTVPGVVGPNGRGVVPPTGQGTESVSLVAIEGDALVPTEHEGPVPTALLLRAGLHRQQVSLLQTPTFPSDVRLHLAHADFLVLEVFDAPAPLSVLVDDGRFVDGRYVVQIGVAGLQIKDLVAQPDGSVSIESLNRTMRVRCRPDELSGVIIHAAVVTPC